MSAQTEIKIYYTASFNGNLDGCLCAAVPRSGLVTSAVLLRQRDRDSSLLLDLGDFMDPFPDDLLYGYFLESFRDLQYDLLVPGEQEFAEGPDFLAAAAADYPVVSGNLWINGKSAGSSDHSLFLRRGIKIGVASLTGKEAFIDRWEGIPANVEIQDPFTAAHRLFAGLTDARAAVRILLYHGGRGEALDLLAQDPWDIVLYAHEGELEFLRTPSGQIAASPGENGNRAGILVLRFLDGKLVSLENSFQLFHYRDDPMDEEIFRRISLYKKEMRSRLLNE